jgi:hypothetical protein
VSRLRIRGTILPLPEYAFMAWCSVKAKGQLDLYVYSIALSDQLLYSLERLISFSLRIT